MATCFPSINLLRPAIQLLKVIPSPPEDLDVITLIYRQEHSNSSRIGSLQKGNILGR